MFLIRGCLNRHLNFRGSIGSKRVDEAGFARAKRLDSLWLPHLHLTTFLVCFVLHFEVVAVFSSVHFVDFGRCSLHDLLFLLFLCFAQLVVQRPIHESLEQAKVELARLNHLFNLLLAQLQILAVLFRLRLVICFILVLRQFIIIIVTEVALTALELAQCLLLLDTLAHVHQTAAITLLIVTVRSGFRMRRQVFLRIGPLTPTLEHKLLMLLLVCLTQLHFLRLDERKQVPE